MTLWRNCFRLAGKHLLARDNTAYPSLSGYEKCMGIDLIYSTGDNKKIEELALQSGYFLGVRSDRKSYHPVLFVDQPYKDSTFTFEQHLSRVAKEQPKYATVPDLPKPDLFSDYCLATEISRVTTQADRLADYCQYPLIIPKWPGQLALIPAKYAIGYSVPTAYGGAEIDFSELSGRKVHLLGGRPANQLNCYRKISRYGQVISADSNAFQVDAKRGGWYFNSIEFVKNPNKERGHIYESITLSLQGIKTMWQRELERVA